ncbi:hypothetical protein [Bacillus sp. T33-2]|uniref:hypothetical protein n=1 Tax=Bacillus sp. T33-2 TaxID=2054168 RepID=UPI000C773D1C|nr:hypothetical protein [Bacillus sp. T33-2]PLR99893.1 hypothetical protein CVD19_02230 [Bacillus sp. T33-2]
MVNVNKKKFLKAQRDIKNRYIGGDNDNGPDGELDSEYNNNQNTDKHPGATGREPRAGTIDSINPPRL